MWQFQRYWQRVRTGLSGYIRVRSVPSQFLRMSSVFGLVFLSCVFGAASLYFDFFPGKFFREAFIGYEALQERGKVPTDGHGHWRGLGVTCDMSSKTFDGFTLYTTTQGTKAYLIDMKGNVVHQWSLPFSKVWEKPKHLSNSPLSDDKIHWFRGHVFPNGDLLALYQSTSDTPPGYGLAKLDKDSNLIWAYSAHAHHDFDVADDGTIYALTQQFHKDQLAGLPSVPTPCFVDYLVHLSPGGRELEKIQFLQAFQSSEFAPILFSNKASYPSDFINGQSMLNAASKNSGVSDILHVNSVKVLTPALAPNFPQFKAGQVLVSFRNLSAIAVLDLQNRSLVWATEGIWQQQHDATFTENGHLLVYDNLGSQGNARVLEFDPKTLGYPWSYTGQDSTAFLAKRRGTKQRLPNGNTLIVDPEGGRILEVTRNRECVWEFSCAIDPELPVSEGAANLAITGARRYGPDQLTFLRTETKVRP